MLRGICEDIIGLKYISTFDPSDRDEVIVLLTRKSTFEFIKKQKTFFESFRPTQPILGKDDAEAEAKKIERELASLQQKYGWKSRKDWPNIREMAETTNLLPLYEYLYAATSSFVHFNPRNLMRMGWGNVKTQEFQYSISNFTAYYDAFNSFYSIFLFVTFCVSFCSMLRCKDEFQPPVSKLIEILDAETRWPELVTFEEMNMVGRKSLSQMLFYSVEGDPNTDRAAKQFWQWA